MYPYNGFSLYVNGPGCVNANCLHRHLVQDLRPHRNLPARVRASAIRPTRSASSDSARGSGPAGSYARRLHGHGLDDQRELRDDAHLGRIARGAGRSGKKLIGIQFQFKPMGTTACTGSFTLDDIKYK